MFISEFKSISKEKTTVEELHQSLPLTEGAVISGWWQSRKSKDVFWKQSIRRDKKNPNDACRTSSKSRRLPAPPPLCIFIRSVLKTPLEWWTRGVHKDRNKWPTCLTYLALSFTGFFFYFFFLKTSYHLFIKALIFSAATGELKKRRCWSIFLIKCTKVHRIPADLESKSFLSDYLRRSTAEIIGGFISPHLKQTAECLGVKIRNHFAINLNPL